LHHQLFTTQIRRNRSKWFSGSYFPPHCQLIMIKFKLQ